MFFAVAVVFDQISVGDAVSAVDFGDAAGGMEDEFDYFTGTAGGGGGSRVHCERWMCGGNVSSDFFFSGFLLGCSARWGVKLR